MPWNTRNSIRKSPPCPSWNRLGILLDAEWSLRDQKRLQSRLRAARLKQPATLEDLGWQGSRRFDRSLLQSLASDDWIRQHRNVLVLGPTGVGKTYIACALGHQALCLGASQYVLVPFG
ncbi:ATP-binding protein [Acidithiobacillus ferrianus]|uniref:IstB-like ATP-binding domain-containing protein n=2 Tax=Acidithiobacillus ferrianus TaxID=2678518 RepID=A0A845U934_9PROT|nr:ATP-binding protein [Acidithiobacillus ferrianus]NDU42277.1 hypothetical protein [Acidithiobacillus ferrianus]